MKKLISIVLALVCASFALEAKHWMPQPTEEVYTAMIAKAREFAEFAKGTPAGDVVEKFIYKVEPAHLDNPYRWIGDTYALVKKLEKMQGPVVDQGKSDFTSMLRRYTLMMVDFPLHVNDKNPSMNPIEKQEYMISRDKYLVGSCKQAIKWLKKTSPAKGEIAIYKVYNMGYIFKTSERAIGIDLRWWGSKADARKLAKNLDVLFTTHPHGDHYSIDMLESMIECRKTIVLTKDLLPKVKSPQKVLLWEDRTEPLDVKGIKVRCFAGNQGKDIPCNVYHLQFDGWTIVHNGDNSDRPRDRRISELEAPDIVVAATWNTFQVIQEAAQASVGAEDKPMLFLPAHENEVGHTIDHRESYREAYSMESRFSSPTFKYIPHMLMDVGECTVVTKQMIAKHNNSKYYPYV